MTDARRHRAAILPRVVAHLLLAIGLALVVLRAGRSDLADLDAAAWTHMGAFVAGFFGLAWLLALLGARGERSVWREALWRSVAVTGAVGLAVVLHGTGGLDDVPTHSLLRATFAGSIGMFAGALWMFASRSRVAVAAVGAALFLAAGVAVTLPALLGARGAATTSEVSTRFVDSSLYQLSVTTFRGFIPDTDTTGGAIARWPGGGFLVATPDGDFFKADLQGGRRLAVRRLAFRAPMDPVQFRAALRQAHGDDGEDGSDATFFRLADLLIEDLGDDVRVVASHHFWKAADGCFVVRVSSLILRKDPIAAVGGWSTLFEAKPCLPLAMGGYRGVRFGGLQIGGGLESDGPGRVVVALGDEEFDGVNSDVAVSQDPAASYGKLVSIPLAGGEPVVLAAGLRNPQRIVRDLQGELWGTDQGPQGGDEINHLRAGANHGWPVVTYGTEYGAHFWPANPRQGQHAGFDQPLYAFVPSVGLSAMTAIAGRSLPLWRGDLLLGTLKAHSLFRVRRDGERVVLVEPIRLGTEIRDLLEDEAGRILALTDDMAVLVIEPAPGHTGAALLQRCLGCHAVARGERGNLAPNLRRIAGADVGATDFRYSAAMRALGGRWSDARLDAFLEDPQAFLPGTSMAFPGIASARDRKALIEYLHTLD
jgi:cytochrome c2